MRNDMGLTNVEIMVLFSTRPAGRAAAQDAGRPCSGAANGLKLIMMRGAQQRHPGRAVSAALRRDVDRDRMIGLQLTLG